ncbi:MAG: vanadium-dependent haloperoxidase [Myxococcota bacterium]
MRPSAWLLLPFAFALGACPDDPEPAPTGDWSVVSEALPGALLSVAGTSATDVWAVGADKGKGPLVLHYDGSAWTAKPTGTKGTLWWAHAFAADSVFFGGANSTVLRYDGTTFTRLPTPGVAHHTVFGLWGKSATDLYAVGSVAGRNGFIWHWDGTAMSEVALPSDIPTTAGDIPGLFKVWGDQKGNVWVVGGNGLVLRSAAGGAFVRIPTSTSATLFTVAGNGDDAVIVGGGTEGVLLEGAGSDLASKDVGDVTLLQGVSFNAKGVGYACGELGDIFVRKGKTWQPVETGLALTVQSLHALWVDPSGGVWAVGGNVLTAALDGGALIHFGKTVPTYTYSADPPPADTCAEADIDPQPNASIARRWDEQILSAIRKDLPRPVVHARNLYHVSAAMWDAWAAYDPTAKGVFVDEDHTAADLDAARQEAISYAAYRVLADRYKPEIAVGGKISEDCFSKLMTKLGYDPSDTTDTGDSPRAVGNRIGKAIVDGTMDDGSNEANNYKDTTGWTSVNPPLEVEKSTITVVDPSIWQPLNLAEAETQNGIPTGAGVQGYIGSNWNTVTPFAMTREHPADLFHDPGPNPTFDSEEVNTWVVDILTRHAKLDPNLPETIDISPGAYGNNSLGANDGHGHAENPVTHQPYAPQVVKLGDFARVLAEFWADGPKSETPPGHWNVLANNVADSAAFERKFEGTGEPLSKLEWDVKTYLALNGALHDAAITAWGTKRVFLGPRPITLIRYKASLGQSSDPSGEHYDADGLPLVPGVIELITAESSAPGERHAALARYVGEIAVKSWRGEPGDRAHETAGVAWMRGVDWLPYQRRTFVTPAFPGFISGHSTFSRAGAEVLAEITGSEYFPGGIGEFVAKKESYLVFEDGPSADIHLQWATYYDAADQAGQSRLWGGIHITPDDLTGRALGSMIGHDALAKAKTFFVAPATN